MISLLIPNTQNARHYRHGYKTAGKYSSEYAIWSNMRTRCHSPTNPNYPKYGARGIKVCDTWRADFLNFLNDMGRRPSLEYTLERKDNDGDYTPENCRWATHKEQARNRRSSRFLVIDDVSKTMAEWAEEAGVGVSTVHARLKAGWDAKSAVNKPVQRKVISLLED